MIGLVCYLVEQDKVSNGQILLYALNCMPSLGF